MYIIILLYHSSSGDEDEYMSFSNSRSTSSIQPRKNSARGKKRRTAPPKKFVPPVIHVPGDYEVIDVDADGDSKMKDCEINFFSGWNGAAPTPNTKSFSNTNNVTPAHHLPDKKMREEAQVQQALFVSMQQHKAEKVQEESQLQQALLMSKQQQTVNDHLLSEQQLQKSRFEELKSKMNSVPKKKKQKNVMAQKVAPSNHGYSTFTTNKKQLAAEDEQRYNREVEADILCQALKARGPPERPAHFNELAAEEQQRYNRELDAWAIAIAAEGRQRYNPEQSYIVAPKRPAHKLNQQSIAASIVASKRPAHFEELTADEDQQRNARELEAWANAIAANVVNHQSIARKVDDIPKPKRGRNAFFIFLDKNRKRVTENNPGFTAADIVSVFYVYNSYIGSGR